MKKKRLFESLSDIDENLLNEAAPGAKKPFPLWKLGTIAACFAVVFVGLSFYLFLPFRQTPPNISRYKNSEYYQVIEKLNEATFQKPAFQNRFEYLYAAVTATGNAGMDGSDPVSGDLASTGTYKEITDNQVQGVIEGDRIKRSDRHMYYLNDSTLEIYTIAGEDSALVGEYTPDDISSRYDAEWEIYLAADCKTVTLVAPDYQKKTGVCVRILLLDVSDPANILKKEEVLLSGAYLSSRMVNENLLIFSKFTVGAEPNFGKLEEFVPHIIDKEGKTFLPMESILVPNEVTAPRYTVVCSLNEEDLSLSSASAFLSYAEDVYVTESHIFATRGFTEITETEQEKGTEISYTTKTEISHLPISEEDAHPSVFAVVDGSVKNRYSMDLYEGVLRVVTTVSSQRYLRFEKDGKPFLQLLQDGSENATLTCLSLQDGSLLAEVPSFAPEGESVRSVRFDGNTAYVCTSIELKDPVFYFDLSDLSHITYKDTGTIDGYSTSLVHYGEGNLLGIGLGDQRSTLKIEVYEEGKESILSLCKYELPAASYADSYKAYYIDRENGFLGLGISNWENPTHARYLLLHFDGYTLHKVLDVACEGENAEKRGFYADGFFYVLGNSLAAYPID